MNNDELLRAIGELIHASEQRIRKDLVTKQDVREIVKEELSLNNKVIGTIVRVEIVAANEKLEKSIEKKLKDQENRISQLEQDHEFPHKN
jgi:bacterioferritin (cytochrome b1)